MAFLEGYDKYNDYNIYCAKLENGKQIYFMSKLDREDERYARMWSSDFVTPIMYPMQASLSEDGSLDFEQFVEYSSQEVDMRFNGLVAMTKPVPPVQNLYLKTIRRLEFLNETPEHSRKILERVQRELKAAESQGMKITFNMYRSEIMRQADKLIEELNGNHVELKDEDLPSNVITFTGKPVLH